MTKNIERIILKFINGDMLEVKPEHINDCVFTDYTSITQVYGSRVIEKQYIKTVMIDFKPEYNTYNKDFDMNTFTRLKCDNSIISIIFLYDDGDKAVYEVDWYPLSLTYNKYQSLVEYKDRAVLYISRKRAEMDCVSML